MGVQHPTPSPQLSCQNSEPDCVSFGVEGGKSSWSNPPTSTPRPPPLWEVPSLTLAGMCLKGEGAWGVPWPQERRDGQGDLITRGTEKRAIRLELPKRYLPDRTA